MRGMLAVVLFIAMTALCWGTYGPVLQWGHRGMEGSHLATSLRAFVCVGLAYFFIAVLAPGLLLRLRGESGAWTASGTIWSLAAGAAGAVGALGIILALASHGHPVYVMPLVFGCAPVVNTFLTMYMGKSYKQAGPLFFAGLILVIVGAVTVLLFKPAPKGAGEGVFSGLSLRDITLILSFVAMAAISWGVYGPILHKGQLAMQGSRLRPLICVGLAYFLIAVLVPGSILAIAQEEGRFTFQGTLWSLAGGAVGALGALGIIMAFNFGGKPVYVMPLVFGGAPVINTFTSIFMTGTGFDQIGPIFYAGLLLVIAGAVTVLVFAPKGKPHATGAKPSAPTQAAIKT